MKLRIRELRKQRGLTIADLADMIDKTPGYISMLERGANQKKPSTTLLEEIARALDVPVHALISDNRPVAVAGRVGAGATVELVDAYAKGDGLYHVACPDDLPASGIVAVEVQGDSMSPIIQNGDVLFFTRHFVGIDENAINRVGICETADGRALVKYIRPGREPHTFDLHSANNSNQTEYSVPLKWAAPLRRHISQQDIQRL